jgi:NAD(P)H-dependent flavin oxidoreductase YrpB (nitropropane dioxygenase family)
MLQTPLCERLGIDVPVICAPMGFVTGPELAAAVSEAGGLGIMSFGPNPPPQLRTNIRRLRDLTDKPFGVNILLANVRGLAIPVDELVAVCLEERVPVLSFFAGDPRAYIEAAHAVGSVVFHQVASVAAAREAAASGVDVVIVQGSEAGGHTESRVGLTALIPRVVDAIAPTPVVAAGGIADARGLVAALALGAEAVSMGTRFVATTEATAHPRYKEQLLAASEEDTESTMLFGWEWPNAPHRVLRTPFVQEWRKEEARGQEGRPDEPVIGETRVAGEPVPVLRFGGFPPSAQTTGDIESMALYAGQGVGLVHAIKPAAEVVRELAEDARQLIAHRFGSTLAGAR